MSNIFTEKRKRERERGRPRHQKEPNGVGWVGPQMAGGATIKTKNGQAWEKQDRNRQ